MITIQKHKLVFAIDYDAFPRILIRVYEPKMGVLYCNYIIPEETPISLLRRLYMTSRDKVLKIREDEDRANEVS